jgi:hypothetical protein
MSKRRGIAVSDSDDSDDDSGGTEPSNRSADPAVVT